MCAARLAPLGLHPGAWMRKENGRMCHTWWSTMIICLTFFVPKFHKSAMNSLFTTSIQYRTSNFSCRSINPFWAATPTGSMTYAFTLMGSFLLIFLLLLCPPPPFPVSRPKFQSQGPNSSLEAQIPVLRPKSQPQGPNPSLKA